MKNCCPTTHIYMEVTNGKESDNVRENWKTVIQIKEYNMKESRNDSVLINHHQGLRKDVIELR